MCNYKYLVLFDADRIHDYVFATGRLKEIIGGSRIVDKFTEEDILRGILSKIRRDHDYHYVYAAGGAGKVLFANEKHAQEFEEEIQIMYRRRTITAFLSTVTVPINGDFKKATREGERRLRQKKGDKREKWQLTRHPLVEFCNSCGQFPVIGEMDQRHLCRSCISKRQEADRLKQYIHSILSPPETAEKPTGIHDFWGTYLGALGDNQWRQWSDDFEVIEEMDQLGQTSHPQRYIGLIYADGNRIGQILQKLDQTEYSVFSKALKEGTKRSLANALAEHLGTPIKSFAPFHPVLIGGDDVIILVAAHKALQVAIDFCKSFASEVKREINKEIENSELTIDLGRLTEKIGRLSSSAAVVLAHANHPVISMLNRAEELLKYAKRLSDLPSSDYSGAIDFLVVTTPTLRPLGDIRKEEYTFGSVISHQEVRCMARPYRTEELKSLIDWVEKFKETGFPKTKLNALYSAMFQPFLQASFDALVIRSRLTDSERDLFNCFLRSFGLWGDFPYRATGSEVLEKESVLTDLVEIYDFV